MDQENVSPCRFRRDVRSGSMDDTPRSRSRTEFRKQFKATTMWNDISSCFLIEGPRKRHRRQFTYVENSFTGKEAVDFLMDEIPKRFLNGRTVSRENCSALLTKFMEKKLLFRYPPSEKKEFRDGNTLYTYAESTGKTPRLIADGTRLNRSNSLKERSAKVEYDQVVSMRGTLEAASPRWSPHQIPLEPSLGGWSRRQSMSHGNLTSLVSDQPDFSSTRKESEDRSRFINVSKRFDTPTCDRTRIEQVPEVTGIEDDPSRQPGTLQKEKLEADSNNVPSASENAYEWLSFGKKRKKKTSTVDELPAETQRPRNVLGEMQSSHAVTGGSTRGSNPNRQPPITNGHCTVPAGSKTPHAGVENGFASLKVSHRMLCEIDVWDIWKTCLIARLNRLLNVESAAFLSWELNGYEIKWNCEKIGSSGVVKSRNDMENFSAFLMRLMQYLEQFPFPTGSCNVITYKDNQEVNVFKTICSYLTREPAQLTSAEASALLDVISLFYDRSISPEEAKPFSPRPGFANTQLETEFSSGSTPYTRVIPRRSFGTASTSSLASGLSDISEPPTAIRTNGLMEGTQFTFSVASDESVSYVDAISPPAATVSTRNRRRSDRLLATQLDPNDVLCLPGLKQSPELLNRLTSMCNTETPQSHATSRQDIPSRVASSTMASGTSSYKTARSLLSPSANSLPRDVADSMMVAISLVLLTLPSGRRRRLHHLIRFMNKISANHCLQLGRPNENRYVILESLCNCIVPADSPLSAVQSVHLVTLLVDNERKVFSVDEVLKSDVKMVTRDKQREKVVATDELTLNDLPTPPTNVVQFCEPIEASNYDDQKDSLDDHLLPILDQYIHNENLKPSEREKKLKQFKKAHPAVYAKRFPLEGSARKENQHGFLRRLFSR